MAIPEPGSLIAIVKPVEDTSATFITRLSAKMADAEVVKNAYRGAGLFTFYVEGYMQGKARDEVTKALKEAGYNVHRLDQQVGFVPPAWLIDVSQAAHGDEGVTGTPTTPWFIVSVSKTKEDTE
jgi:hypothetical protein